MGTVMDRATKLVLLLLLLIVSGFVLNLQLLGNDGKDKLKRLEKLYSMSLEELMNVEIDTAGKTLQKISEIPASVILVTRADIAKYGYRSLAEILRNIPGLYMTDDNYAKRIGVRGFWTYEPQRSFVILVNDVMQYEAVWGSYFLENINIPVEAIDRIEVVRGPMSIIYGGGAFYGAINIKTNQANRFNQLVALTVGSQGYAGAFIRTEGTGTDFKYFFNGRYHRSDGIDSDYPKMSGGVGELESGQLSEKSRYMNFSAAFKAFHFNASYSELKKGSFFLLPSTNDGTTSLFRNTRIGFGFKDAIGDQFSYHFNLDYFEYQQKWTYDWFEPEFFAEQVIGNTGFFADFNLFYKPSDHFELSAGIWYRHMSDIIDRIDVPLLGFIHDNKELQDGEAIRTAALFTQLDYRLSNQLKLVAGIRFEQLFGYGIQKRDGISDEDDPDFGYEKRLYAMIDRSDLVLIPRLALLYTPSKSHVMKFLFGKAINHPIFFHNIELLGNPDPVQLEPEVINAFEISYSGQWNDQLVVSLNLFRNELDKLIFRTQIYQDGLYSNVYANVGKLVTNGIELNVRTQLMKQKLGIDCSVIYQKTTDKRDGYENMEPGYSPKLLGYLKASYLFSDRISLAVTGNFVDKMESYYDAVISDRIGEQTPAYFLLGFNFRLNRFLHRNLYASLKIANLLDAEIRYPATANSNLFARYGHPGTGRSFYMSIGAEF